MAKSKRPKKTPLEAIKHKDRRRNIPTEELRDFVAREEGDPETLLYPRDPSLDPQLVWKGKDEQDREDLAVPVVPIYIQEKIHPRGIIEDFLRDHRRRKAGDGDHAGEDPAAYGEQLEFFADFNGLPEEFDARVDFYSQRDELQAHWSNRMILGDSLHVMTSLAEKEGLRGKVQCIYLDPPYGIKFGSNWQVSTRKRDVKDGRAEHATRQPEQVRAFRDTWKLGIHSYLAYLRDRLTVARDLLTETGSIFVQIGDENVHLVRSVLDEVFGSNNFVSLICIKKTGGVGAKYLDSVFDYIIWYAKRFEFAKYRALITQKVIGEGIGTGKRYDQVRFPDLSERGLTKLEREDPAMMQGLQDDGVEFFQLTALNSESSSESTTVTFRFQGVEFFRTNWKTNALGLQRLSRADRIRRGDATLRYRRHLEDFPGTYIANYWDDTGVAGKVYVVQTSSRIIQRCILMTTDPGDLVLDPTCGSGTTAYVAEQWGRRWITIDTSRVALALARTRLMGARYPYYLLADSPEGVAKEAELTGQTPPPYETGGDIRKGFVYRRVPHITLKSIANNAEIDDIHEKWRPKVEAALSALNEALRGQGLPFEVITGGRAGMSIDFTSDEFDTVELASGENAPANAFLEWEVPRLPETPWNKPLQRHYYVIKSEIAKGSEANAALVVSNLSAINMSLKRKYTLENLPERPADPWPEAAKKFHKAFWDVRIARQREMDASIARRADTKLLYDQPYEDKKTLRVSGPFTVESLSPHRVLPAADANLDGTVTEQEAQRHQDFAEMILDNLRKAGVQNTKKGERLKFDTLEPYPGKWIHAAGEYTEAPADESGEGEPKTRSVAVSIGPEHGTVGADQVKEAAKEAVQGLGFDLLIVCGFAFDPHVSEEVKRYGRLNVLPTRMNPDLAMGEDLLKKTGAGNLFMVFGEPDVEVLSGEWLVASNGRMIAHHATVKELSGLRSLEEINRLGGADLPRLKQISAGREVRADQPDTPGGGVGGGKRGRGRGKIGDGGVPSVSKRGERVAGRSGDLSDSGGQAGLLGGSGPADAGGAGGRDKPDARRAQALAAIQALTPGDFPLSLATSHYAQVTLLGVDVYDPTTGDIRSDSTDEIACWFIDTEYNGERFMVRHAYFTGADEPYKNLKRALRADIDEAAWAELYSAVSRPFTPPETGKIAVKVINHYGDEVLKVFDV